MAISFQSTLSLGTGNTPGTNLASKMSGKIAAGASIAPKQSSTSKFDKRSLHANCVHSKACLEGIYNGTGAPRRPEPTIVRPSSEHGYPDASSKSRPADLRPQVRMRGTVKIACLWKSQNCHRPFNSL
jgi:hypothetical protein